MDKFTFFKSYIDAIEDLEPEEFKKTILAICSYAWDGTETELSGAAKVAYKLITPIIDKGAEISEIRSEAGKRGNEKRWGNRKTIAKDRKTSQSDNERIANDRGIGIGIGKGIGEGNITPKPPKRGKGAPIEILNGMVENSNLAEPVKNKVKEWIQYKQERREPYQETGFRNLLTQISKHEQQIGPEAVINTISVSMGNEWKGIIWDAVKPTKEPFNATAYLLSQIGET